MNQSLAFFSTVLLASFLAACTGYSNGPAISLRSAETKIANTWIVDEALLNGADATADYTDEFFRFNGNGTFERLENTYQTNIPPVGPTVSKEVGQGDWFFRNGESQVELLYQFETTDPLNPSVDYVRTVNQLWTISRLTQEELWLEDDSTSLKLTLRNP